MNLLTQGTERMAYGYSDQRAVFGSEAAPVLSVAERRTLAWRWLLDQWELWPRPELVSAITRRRVTWEKKS